MVFSFLRFFEWRSRTLHAFLYGVSSVLSDHLRSHSSSLLWFSSLPYYHSRATLTRYTVNGYLVFKVLVVK